MQLNICAVISEHEKKNRGRKLSPVSVTVMHVPVAKAR